MTAYMKKGAQNVPTIQKLYKSNKSRSFCACCGTKTYRTHRQFAN